MTPADLTVDQAAAGSGHSAEYLRQRIRLGELPARKHGRDYAIDPADLDRWLARPKAKPGPKPGTPRAARVPP